MMDKQDNLCDAPTYQIDNIFYNCTECLSMIEIIEINIDKIKFKCLNNKEHIKEIEIKEYLEKMKAKNENKIKINDDECKYHNNKYISYCFDCKCHLCNECLKKREHINHYKNNIIEINPTEEEINIITELIN